MTYPSLRSCIDDLHTNGDLAIINDPVDPFLEMAAIQRMVYAAGGPAVLFTQVKGSPFQAVSNVFGTIERTHFIFRNTLDPVRKIIGLKSDPALLLRKPGQYAPAIFTALKALPRQVRRARVTYGRTSLGQLPQIVSWPKDGGAFITLPQVFTLPPDVRNPMQANVGMYRIQISGGSYEADLEAGMHYQLHRGIGVHHAAYNTSDTPFRVSIFVGGPPAHSLAAVMPLPEGLSELTFAGMLAGRRFRFSRKDGYVLSADADFCITGTIQKQTQKPEGPFGDHLGYYSLQHDFPVLKIDSVYHRKDAIWPFTVVGRPPQEDTSFGHLIHEIAGPLLPSEFPGITEVNAVDAAGVHPLLLAIGQERYMPFRDRRPEEILTQANHLLGKGQTSLAKYLMIAATGDHPNLTVNNIEEFIGHILKTFDPMHDLHFQTNTTIDTLDYSGTGFNAGSKLVIAACCPPRRELATAIPNWHLPSWISDTRVVSPGILAVSGTPYQSPEHSESEVHLLEHSASPESFSGFPLIVFVDDAHFVSQSYRNFLWVTFTRSNPSHDVYGIQSAVTHKHWGCRGPVIIDARIKPHHAPVLEEDPKALQLAERHFRKGAPLEKWG
jgi:4-hydroxy-3-polyprenylbenzoate decarboxylase